MDEGVEEIPLGLYIVKGDMMCVSYALARRSPSGDDDQLRFRRAPSRSGRLDANGAVSRLFRCLGTLGRP